MRNLRIGIIQQRNSTDTADNMTRLKQSIEALALHGAQLIILPELHNTLYFPQTEDARLFALAEPIPGPSTAFFGALAREHHIVIVASLFERRAPGLYHNTAVVLDSDGTIAGTYRKMHIPDDPAYYEKYYFAPGDNPFAPIDTAVGRLGVQICWDQWFPEGARLMALAGADMLIYPTAIGYNPDDTPQEQQRQRQAWITIQQSHAIANALHVIAVNRVGQENDTTKQTKGINFWGTSFVATPQGENIFEATDNKEHTQTIDIDLDTTERIRREWPFLRDRRTDQYQNITKRYID